MKQKNKYEEKKNEGSKACVPGSGKKRKMAETIKIHKVSKFTQKSHAAWMV